MGIPRSSFQAYVVLQVSARVSYFIGVLYSSLPSACQSRIRPRSIPVHSSTSAVLNLFCSPTPRCDRLCGLVVKVPSYRSTGPGSIPGATRFSEK
jgi:hypothetical protein